MIAYAAAPASRPSRPVVGAYRPPSAPAAPHGPALDLSRPTRDGVTVRCPACTLVLRGVRLHGDADLSLECRARLRAGGRCSAVVRIRRAGGILSVREENAVTTPDQERRDVG